MTTTSRQNSLILNEDWRRIYQTFKNADFKSYDFENLRRVIIAYFRENYPEDFNDYIESSEYLALIDAVAFLGQSLAFRVDLASRENFLELAERKESILRLAKMLSYNAKRNIAAKGLLKFDTVSTTENVLDSNGKNLAQQTIVWNDPTNSNWSEQFITVLNSAMADNTEFGRSQGNAVIDGIATDQYRFRTASIDVPIFTFSKIVAGRQMTFELTSTAFRGKEEIYEESPTPGNQLGFIYKNDGRGGTSANTGFFLLFKQGTLELADFSVAVPTTNEIVTVDSNNINNDDVWLFNLSSTGIQQDEWTKVQALTGNNIAYNSIVSDIRNIYSIITKENDRIDLAFGDGVYSNLPQGAFRVYYRKSNGLVYQITPNEMQGIAITIPYVNKAGAANSLTVTLSLKYTVSSSAAAESIDSIRVNAPAQYYTQNRMITGEDYNLAPLSTSQDILKVKAVNRTSSGISRNFDILDASGKYSNVTVFADDGLIYQSDVERSLSFKFINRIDIVNFIKNRIEPVFTDTDIYNFYLTKFDKILFTDQTFVWNQTTTDVNSSTGFFTNANDPNSKLKVGTYTTSTLRYVTISALIKFIPPVGEAFKNGELVPTNSLDPDQRQYLWTKAVQIVGDGTANNTGILTSGLGPVQFSDVIPTRAIAERVIAKFVNNLPQALENEMTNLITANLNFGLRYSTIDSQWKIITAPNLNLLDEFSLGKAGDVTNSGLDSSWNLAFVKEPDQYVVRIRGVDYIFGSIKQNRFYYDDSQRVYDSRTNSIVKDQVNVLGINTDSGRMNALKQDQQFEICDAISFDDGYQSTEEIKITFYDSDSDGVIDDPDSFDRIVGTNTSYLFFQEITDSLGNKIKKFVDNTSGNILIEQRESSINVGDFQDGQLIYFSDIDENVVKRVNGATNTLILESAYSANRGRADLKFQYIHTANVDRRIDPSSSNIIDVYLLTRSYDIAYRNYLAGAVVLKPEAPTSDSLRINFGSNLNLIKSISDEIIYHPVEYKVLFGSTADVKLQAQFKVVKNANKLINDNDLKVRIISAINTFFDINNWDFGDKFFVSELITYVINTVAPDVSNMVIVPRQASQTFGSLFEIQSRVDEIFVSGARVDDIEIIQSITAAELRVSPTSIITSTGQ